MTRLLLAGLLLAIALCRPVGADSETRQDKLLRIVELKGLESYFTTVRAQVSQDDHLASDALLEQIRLSVDAADREFADRLVGRLKAQLTEFLEASTPPWTAERVSIEFAEAYGANLSDSDIEMILQFLESDAGRKDLSAQSKALAAWTAEYKAQADEARAAAWTKLMESSDELMKAIAEDDL